MKSDMHGPILEVNLLVAFGTFETIRAPALSDLFFGVVGFLPLEVIFKYQSFLILRLRNQWPDEKGQNENAFFHGSGELKTKLSFQGKEDS